MSHQPASQDPLTSPLLRVRELGVEIAGRAVVTGVSFDVTSGRTLAIVG